MKNDPNNQSDLFQTSPSASDSGSVECLGMTFPSDEARRKHFLALLREKLQEPEFRKGEGFPIGSDEDILALSDPPYYTACPNPWIADFVSHYGKPYDPSTPYRREPFAVDVSEGKTDPIYKAHSYHTKVPHLAIMPSILHYTEPGDVVLDGFCGSGMTGVAAQMCSHRGVVESLGYRVDDDGTILRREAAENGEADWKPVSKLGSRRVVLNDLSPAATFIAANYTLPFDVREFARAGRRILDEVESEIGWMYRTLRTDEKGATGESPETWAKALDACRTTEEIRFLLASRPSAFGTVEYTVWSEVFTCPDCSGEVVFLDEALDDETKRVRETFPCPHCGSELTKKRLERCVETRLDPQSHTTIRTPKRRPSLISYGMGKKRHEKVPDAFDLKVLKKIEELPFPQELPTDRMMHAPEDEENWGDKWRAGTASFTHVHHLFLPRAAHALALLWRKAIAHPDARMRNMLLFFVEQAIWTTSVLNRYQPQGYKQVNKYLPGVYYLPSQNCELSPWYAIAARGERIAKTFTNFSSMQGNTGISTNTATCLRVPDEGIDYIFTDPPFGDNLAYGELNFLVESFHRCFTNMEQEAIVSPHQKKGLSEYQGLMRRCFAEYCRVLKPGRWMTVVFHNSRNAVWTAIQESLQVAGFVVADVRVLDKQQGSFNQAVATGSVKQDLVISAYKPNGGLEDRFKLEAGTENGVWDFVRTHLRQLPVFVSRDGLAEVVAERQNYLLFDRMVAFHVQRGVTVPLSAAEFYAGLPQRFSERDRMYFLPEQTAEYDKKRLTVREVLQLQFFVIDESSAIQWLRQQLLNKPQTFQELHPQFLKEIGGWQKHEKPLELSELLEQNFLRYDGKGEVPNSIHGYLSSNFKELRNLPKDDENLRTKAKDRWYVPDPNKARDLEGASRNPTICD